MKSRRGSKGGYVLMGDPRKVTIADILSVMEGKIALAPCQTEDCKRATQCVTRHVWRKASEAMSQIFSETTLHSMTLQADGLRSALVNNYEI